MMHGRKKHQITNKRVLKRFRASFNIIYIHILVHNSLLFYFKRFNLNFIIFLLFQVFFVLFQTQIF